MPQRRQANSAALFRLRGRGRTDGLEACSAFARPPCKTQAIPESKQAPRAPRPAHSIAICIVKLAGVQHTAASRKLGAAIQSDPPKRSFVSEAQMDKAQTVCSASLKLPGSSLWHTKGLRGHVDDQACSLCVAESAVCIDLS